MPGIASSSPPVLIAHLAASTATIRDRRGRRDAARTTRRSSSPSSSGCSRRCIPGASISGSGARPAPIRSPPPRCAARRRALGADEFPEQLRDLFVFFDGHASRRSPRCPDRGYRPAVWMLGSSDFSAQVAGALGLPFSFAHHFASHNTVAALEIYRDAFRPSAELEQPYAMIGVPVICAETDERARWLVGPERALVRPPASGPADAAPDARGGGRVRVHPGRARDRPELDRAARPRRARPRARRARSARRSAPAPTS